MKVEDTNSSEFEPFWIKIRIDTVDELCHLWHRLKILPAKLAELSTKEVPLDGSVTGRELFEAIDKRIHQLGLYFPNGCKDWRSLDPRFRERFRSDIEKTEGR